MKTIQQLLRKGNQVLFLIALACMSSVTNYGQAPQTVFARVVYQKVEPGKTQEFEKMIKENWKAAHQLRKQNGKITNWALYRVNFTGENDQYNYVSVSYYDSWAKTEGNDNFSDLLKATNPKVDPAITIAKTQAVRKIVRQALYSRVDFVSAQNAPPTKFVQIDFMKTKEGMNDEYLRVELEEWKPVHQALTDAGKRNGWSLWSQVFPGGTASSHNYVTGNIFSSYAQMGEGGFEEAFKKAHPGKNVDAALDRTFKSRDGVRSELWELIESLN